MEEAPLSDPIKGTSDFAKTFAAQGSRDRQGRSLREFELQTRLFKYPCSYLIYSEAFDQLPDKMKERIYRRLWEILTGKDSSANFQKLSDQNKAAILEILRQTKSGLPGYWKE